MPDDFYDLLDVSPDAPPEEIRAAYRSKAREFHPDVNDDERAGPQFKAVRRAYDVLTDEEERAAYDEMGHEAYVAGRMGGLPTHGAGAGASPGEGSERARSRQHTARSNATRSASSERSAEGGSDRARDDSRYGDGEAFTARRRHRRASRRRRRRAADAGAVLGTVAYGVGLGAFLRATPDAFAAGADPLAFVRTASLGPLLAAGVALFAVGVGAAALRTDRRRGALVAAAALGPATGLALAAAGTTGAAAFATSLVAAPLAAVVGVLALVARR